MSEITLEVTKITVSYFTPAILPFYMKIKKICISLWILHRSDVQATLHHLTLYSYYKCKSWGEFFKLYTTYKSLIS
jgi:hypothetical protein